MASVADDAVSVASGRTCSANEKYGMLMCLPVSLEYMTKIPECECCGHKADEGSPFDDALEDDEFGGLWPWARCSCVNPSLRLPPRLGLSQLHCTPPSMDPRWLLTPFSGLRQGLAPS